MAQFTRTVQLPVSADDLFAWHARPGAFERLVPPGQAVRIAWREPGIEGGAKAELRVGPGPFALKWVAEHHTLEPGRVFTDAQQRGPFAEWVHRHTCAPEGPDASTLEDHITWRMPLEPVSRWVAGWFFERMLDQMFRFRHHRTRCDLERHAAWRDAPRLRVAISGPTGVIGAPLTAYLGTAGHTVQPLVRGAGDIGTLPATGAPIRWSSAREEIDLDALEGVDVMIHLAGASVGQRWTPEHKRLILDSRVKGTRTIAQALTRLKRPPRAFLCASAIGLYGYDASERAFTEADGPADNFLADVVRQWEAAAQPAVDAGIRTAFLRIGVVLAPGGGALGSMLTPFKLGLGGPVGSGRQWLSWIGLDDVLGAIELLMHRDDLSGPFNLVAPEAVRQAEFARAFGRVLRRPAFLPAPAAALRLLFGEMSEVVLDGIRVTPQRLTEAGFTFLTPGLDAALRHELGMVGA